MTGNSKSLPCEGGDAQGKDNSRPVKDLDDGRQKQSRLGGQFSRPLRSYWRLPVVSKFRNCLSSPFGAANHPPPVAGTRRRAAGRAKSTRGKSPSAPKARHEKKFPCRSRDRQESRPGWIVGEGSSATIQTFVWGERCLAAPMAGQLLVPSAVADCPAPLGGNDRPYTSSSMN
jgi:hypothetical protein